MTLKKVAYNATVGIDFKVRRLEIDGKTVKIQIWDTAGQEKFNAITTAYYRQARAAVVMYDTTRWSSKVYGPIVVHNMTLMLVQEYDLSEAILNNLLTLKLKVTAQNFVK